MVVVVFRLLTFWERFLELLWPPRRKRREARLYARIRWLVEHPDVPVDFE